jgi:haloacetate dehalogenase
VLALWGGQDRDRRGDLLAVWRGWADDVRGEALPCGHFLAEEQPDATASALERFFVDGEGRT